MIKSQVFCGGMHYEGLLRHYYKTRDGFHDCTLYGIIRNEWEQIYEVACLWNKGLLNSNLLNIW